MEKYFTVIRSSGKYDAEFVDLLINSYAEDEAGEETAQKAIELIDERYDKNKKNKT